MKTKSTGWEYLTSVESDSKPGRFYDIKRRLSDDVLGCACVSYRFCKGEKTCKHLDAYRLGERVVAAVVNRGEVGRLVSQTVGGETFTFRRAISLKPLTAASGGA